MLHVIPWKTHLTLPLFWYISINEYKCIVLDLQICCRFRNTPTSSFVPSTLKMTYIENLIKIENLYNYTIINFYQNKHLVYSHFPHSDDINDILIDKNKIKGISDCLSFVTYLFINNMFNLFDIIRNLLERIE